jgi:hypothetical protein
MFYGILHQTYNTCYVRQNVRLENDFITGANIYACSTLRVINVTINQLRQLIYSIVQLPNLKHPVSNLHIHCDVDTSQGK